MRGWTRFLLVLGFLMCGGCGGKSTDQLIADLQSGEERERIIAARTLPYRTADKAKVVPAMIASLQDHDNDVRRSAAIALGQFGDQARDAIPALRAAENDPDIRVRRAAGNALTRIDPTITAKPAAMKPRGKRSSVSAGQQARNAAN